MRRRDFITFFGAAVAWPLAARAQQARKVPRIGILDFFPSAASATYVEPFQQGLREFGYFDGRNIQVEYHSAELSTDLAATLAAELVRGGVDVIVAVATPAAHAAKNATATIPIVMQVSDPLATGLVASLALPGGNLTGVTSSGPDLTGKRLELLRELRPDLGLVAFLGAVNDPNTHTFLNETQAAAEFDPRAPAAAACGGAWGIRDRLHHYDQATSARTDCSAALSRTPSPARRARYATPLTDGGRPARVRCGRSSCRLRG